MNTGESQIKYALQKIQSEQKRNLINYRYIVFLRGTHHLLLAVWEGADDEEPVQQVQRDTVGGHDVLHTDRRLI